MESKASLELGPAHVMLTAPQLSRVHIFRILNAYVYQEDAVGIVRREPLEEACKKYLQINRHHDQLLNQRLLLVSQVASQHHNLLHLQVSQHHNLRQARQLISTRNTGCMKAQQTALQ